MGTTGSLTSSSYDNFFEFPSLLLTNDSTAYHKLFFASYQRNGVFFLLIFSPMHVNIIHVHLYRSFSVTWSAAFQIAWNKRSFNIWKEFNSHRIFFVHKYGRRSIVLYTNMAAVTSCENDLFMIQNCIAHSGDLKGEIIRRLGTS